MTPSPASPDEIRNIVGDVDDAVISDIMRTGATEGEVLEAFLWTTSDEELGNEVERLPHGAVGAVVEILRSQEPEHSAEHSPESLPPSHWAFTSPGLIFASHLPAQSAMTFMSASQRGGTMSRLGKFLRDLDRTRLPVHVTPPARAMIEGMARAVSRPQRNVLLALLKPHLK